MPFQKFKSATPGISRLCVRAPSPWNRATIRYRPFELHTKLMRVRAPVVVHRCPNGVHGANSQGDGEVVHAPGDSRIFAVNVFPLGRLPKDL
jgi:hypothetical protein